MKTIRIVFFSVWFIKVLFIEPLNGQVHDSIFVSTPGTLYSCLTEEQKNTITALTVAGTIDWTDFSTLRDSMPVLDTIDISSSSITGNSIPDFAFHLKQTLRHIILPQNIAGIGIASFGSTGLITLNIPDGVTSIGDNAFSNCENLISAVIPSSITYLGWGTFANCSKLTEITIPPVEAIGMFTFSGCSALKYLEIPSTVETIGMSAFQTCIMLDSIQIPSSVVSIGPCAFFGCWALKNVKLPESLKKLEDMTFGNCFSLVSIIIPESVTCIGRSVFVTDTVLSTVSLPSNLDTIDYGAFGGCHNLDPDFYISAGVSYIGKGVFMAAGVENITVHDGNPNYSSEMGVLFNKDKSILIEYPALKKDELYIIPGTVKEISDYGFYWCPNLKSLFIPESITSIGNYAFTSTNNLTDIRIFNSEPPDLSGNPAVFSWFNTDSCVLSVPEGSKTAYESAAQWNKFGMITEFMSGLDLSENIVSFSDTGGIATFKIYTPLIWNIDNPGFESWLEIEPVSGADTATITLTAASNMTTSERSIILSIETNYAIFQKSLEVRQAAPTIINLKKHDNKQLRIYPLPATDLLKIEGAQGSDIEIITSQGQILITQKALSHIESIDISDLQSGVYFLRIRGQESAWKLVKGQNR